MRIQDQAHTSDMLEESVELFKAFADPVRLRLLNILARANGEVCVCHLHDALNLPQSTVSRHLAYLRSRGLVIGRKDGLWVHYQLAKPSGALHRVLIDALDKCDQLDETLANDFARLSRSACRG